MKVSIPQAFNEGFKLRWLYRLYPLLIIIVLPIVLLASMLSLNPAVSSAQSFATNQPALPAVAPRRIHIKLRDDVAVPPAHSWLPAHLSPAVTAIEPLFNLSPQLLNHLRIRGMQRSGEELPNLNHWIQIDLAPNSDIDQVIDGLLALDIVEFAEPAPIPAPLPMTPDFTGNQGYLVSATNGINAVHSWAITGGNGRGITIFDIEYGWQQEHEDLSKAHGLPLLLVPGDSNDNPYDDEHGTAVLGELIADNDGKGVTGISWGADISLAPANTTLLGYNPANAILLAVANGSAGDVILIEQQYWICDTGNFGPLEVLTSVFNAIQIATANGFVVVEAAGNGGENLDQAACEGIFDRTVRDSGAIIVGAGRSPASGFDRHRDTFSSYGSRLDLQGWGSGVMTTGYGDFYVDAVAPENPNFWYTASFNGTSSASPIVAGAVANLQGIAKQFGPPLSPAYVRALLVQTGSPQQGDTSQHIGPRPDLEKAIAPDLALHKTVAPTSTLFPGQTITYTLTFTNNNVYTATDTLLTDFRPVALTNLTVISSNVILTATDFVSGFAWIVADIAYSQQGVIVVRGQVSPTLTAGTTFTTTATINTPAELFPADNMAPIITSTVTVPLLNFERAADSVPEGAGSALITVTMTPASVVDVTADLVTRDVTAVAGQDYAAVSRTLTITAGTTAVSLALPITDDFIVESSETLSVTLLNLKGATVFTPAATLNITDNDTAGLEASPLSSPTTSEAGLTATFTVSLTSQPAAPVTLTLTSNNPSEGLPIPNMLVFDALNWSLPQRVVIAGQDDSLKDGPSSYTITFTPTISLDSHYNGLVVADLSLTNLDDDPYRVYLPLLYIPPTNLLYRVLTTADLIPI